jgi:hypothetical protein
MEDSKVMTHATISALLQITPTGSVLAQWMDSSTQPSSSMLRTRIAVTELVFSALQMHPTPYLEPSLLQNLLRQLLVKTILQSNL